VGEGGEGKERGGRVWGRGEGKEERARRGEGGGGKGGEGKEGEEGVGEGKEGGKGKECVGEGKEGWFNRYRITGCDFPETLLPGSVESAELPFTAHSSSDHTSVEEMRQLVCSKKIRPTIAEHWSEDEVRTSVCECA
jgi:hypothetical protein